MYKQYILAVLVSILYILILFMYIHGVVYFEGTRNVLR
jgi:hypothetical protein